MELPPPEELADWLRETRTAHDVTQTELAERSEVSPSQISRIESQRGGTAYETIYRIQQELLALIETESTLQVADVLSKKHATHPDDYELAYVEPTASIETGVDIMQGLKVSQLPVFENGVNSVGRLTERDLLEATNPTDVVKDHMRPPFPEIAADTPASIARDLLETNEAVLITAGKADRSPSEEHGYVGILTPSDFARTRD